jgi:hypothetical protein
MVVNVRHTWLCPKRSLDYALGRALETLYAYGVTELYSLIAATAAERFGVTPTFAHIDSTSFQVDDLYNMLKTRRESPS